MPSYGACFWRDLLRPIFCSSLNLLQMHWNNLTFSYKTQKLHLRSLALPLLSVSQVSHSATASLTSSNFHFSTVAGVVFRLEAETEDYDDCFGFDKAILLDCFWLAVCF